MHYKRNMNIPDWIADIFSVQQIKITSSRKSIAVWLVNSPGIFSSKEILSELPYLNKVSVYRTLDLFASLDIIHPVLSQHGEQHYDVQGQAHHHHVVCTGCEKASCVDCEVKRTKIKGFSSIHHSVVFTGLCNTCAVF